MVERVAAGTAMVWRGQLMPRFVFADPADRRDGHPDRREVTSVFKQAVGPGLNQFRDRCCGGGPRSGTSR
jgi:hypothetical protein